MKNICERITKFKILLFFLLILISSCSKKQEVIIYVAHDQVYSEPILKEFEKNSGIKVKALYDTEATKTVGLVNRLISEKDNPQCDVFWNNEIIRTIVLKKKGILDSYKSPSAEDIPEMFQDKDNTWTGFAARARVIIYNSALVKESDAPKSNLDFTDKKWKGKFAVTNPLFGTYSAQCAALFELWGDEKAKEYFTKLKENNAIVVDGNSVVKDRVASGEIPAGLTDTDDANIGILDGYPVKIIYPDQEGMGTFVFPNTVSLIKGARNTENAGKLIDYILSKEVEGKLAFSQSAQMPLRPDVNKPENVRDYKSILTMSVDFEKVAERIENSGKFLQEVFIK
ncbi:MAG: extracellular solute-binding protein [bacterium]